MPASQFSNPLSIGLGANPGPVTFANMQEVEDWLATEEAFWTHLVDSPRGGSIFSASRQQKKRLRGLVDPIRSWASLPEQQYFENLSSALSNNYGAWKLLHSQTKWAQRIVKLSEAKPDDAATLLWAVLQLNRSVQGVQTDGLNAEEFAPAMAAMARTVSIEDGWDNASFAARATALDSIESDLKNRNAKWVERTDQADKELRAAKRKFGELDKKQQEEFESRLKNHDEVLDKQLNAARERIEELEALFGQKIQLEAPVEYWRSKVAGHGTAGKVWGIFAFAFIGLPFVLAVGGLIWFPHLMLSILSHLTTQGGLALLVFFAVLYLAGTRLVVKQYAGNVALRDDASERVVMAQTFLALVHDKQLTDAERALVLAPLFRPHGVSSDADVAAGLADAIAKVVTTGRA